MFRLPVPLRAWILVVCVATGGFLVALAFRPMPMLLSFLSDDAFYYLQIGRSIAEGDGSTFDGIARTNGYHPLWMLVVVAAMKLTGGAPILSAAVVLALSAVLCAVAILLSICVVERHVARDCGAVAFALMLSPFAFSAMTNGMETSLAMLAVLTLFWFCTKTGALGASADLRTSLVLGLLLALVFLSRLDLAFVPLAAALLITVNCIRARVRPAAFVARSSAILFPFLLVVTPYVALNVIGFGSASPISGTVKSSFPVIRESLHLEGDSGIGLMMAIALLVLTAIHLVGTNRRGEPPQAVSAPLLLATIASWLHFAYAYLYMDWGVYWWHFTLSAVSLSIAAPAALASLKIGGVRLTAIASAVFVLSAGLFQLSVLQNRQTRHAAWLEAAEWARSNTDPDAVFAVKDAGLFRYFSGRRVVNLDGKANGVDYWQHVKAGTVEAYLDRVGVTYLGEINAYCNRGNCSILILVPRQPDVFLTMSDKEQVYAGPWYPSRIGSAATADTQFRIWRRDAH